MPKFGRVRIDGDCSVVVFESKLEALLCACLQVGVASVEPNHRIVLINSKRFVKLIQRKLALTHEVMSKTFVVQVGGVGFFGLASQLVLRHAELDRLFKVDDRRIEIASFKLGHSKVVV
jgi:hypothetical protein